MKFVLNQTLAAATCFLFVWSLTGPTAMACPCCYYTPILTLRDHIQREDVTVIATLQSSRPPGAVKGDDGQATFIITKLQYTSTNSSLKPGDVIQLGGYHEGRVGDAFLLMGICRDNYQIQKKLDETKDDSLKRIETSHLLVNDFIWYAFHPAADDLISYLDFMPLPAKPAAQFIYYQSHLESANPIIADDAYTEISRLSYPEMVELARHMSPEKLREYIYDRNTPVTRIGQYGIMLGLCGNAADMKMLEDRILYDENSFRIEINGIMTGYLMLAKEDGLQVLVNNIIKPFCEMDPAVRFSEAYAAMEAVRFISFELTPEQIDHNKIKQAFRLYLLHPDTADIVIKDLARLEDWSIADQLLQMFEDERFNAPSIKREIVGYFLVLLDADRSKSTCPDVAAIEKGTALIKEVEANNPKILQHARRLNP